MHARLPEKIEGDVWLLVDHPWVKSERKAIRRRRRSRYRQHLKREAHRLMRRLGQQLLDDAPRRLPTSGWEW